MEPRCRKSYNRRMISARLLTALLLASAVPSILGAQVLPKAAPARQMVILDTDIGDDIDDAFALALVLRCPELQLLGVETAFGDTELRARLVDRYLAAVGRSDVPVLAGVSTANTNFTQAAYARQSPPRKHAAAVSFLLAQARAHPGQITLIAIGPLFNIQAAIARDPVTFKKLKRVVIMGGSVYRGYDNHNGITPTPRPRRSGTSFAIRPGPGPCSPPEFQSSSCRSTPRRSISNSRMLGTILSHGSPLTDQLTLLYHQWTGATEWHSPTLFDPVAVTFTIRPDLCPVKPMRLEVGDKGFTRPAEGAPNVQVCLHSNENGFLQLLVGRLVGEPTH